MNPHRQSQNIAASRIIFAHSFTTIYSSFAKKGGGGTKFQIKFIFVDYCICLGTGLFPMGVPLFEDRAGSKDSFGEGSL